LGKRPVTITQDLPVELDLEGSRWTRYDGQGVRKLFDELEFRQLLSRFPLPDAVAIPTQATLAFEPVREDGGPLIVSDDASATPLLGQLEGTEEAAVFGLWDGSARGGDLLGVAVAAGEGAYYVPAGPALDRVVDALRGPALLGHDVKEMDLALATVHPHRFQWAFSTSLAAYLLGAGSRDPRLEDLARDFLGMNLMPTDQLVGSGRNVRPAGQAADRECADYAGARARAVLHLGPRLGAEMQNLGVHY